MKFKRIIVLLLLSFSIILSWCTTDKDIETKISIFWKEQVQKCKEEVDFTFWKFFDQNGYCPNLNKAICKEIFDTKFALENDCERIGLETQQLIQNIFYEPYYSAPY